MLRLRCIVDWSPTAIQSLGMATERDIMQALKPHVNSTMRYIAIGRVFHWPPNCLPITLGHLRVGENMGS
jgi:hypothetical protein